MSEDSDKAVVYSAKKGFLKNKTKIKNGSDQSFNSKFPIKKYLVVTLIMLLLLLAVVGMVVYKRQQQKNKDYEKNIESSLGIKNASNVNDLVRDYGKDQNNYKNELQNSNSEKWDKEKLDKVYFNLIYADKVGSFNEVYAMLFFIDTAKKSGLDIDDNSYGIDQNERSQIKLRADKIVESRTNSVKENNE